MGEFVVVEMAGVGEKLELGVKFFGVLLGGGAGD